MREEVALRHFAGWNPASNSEERGVSLKVEVGCSPDQQSCRNSAASYTVIGSSCLHMVPTLQARDLPMLLSLSFLSSVGNSSMRRIQPWGQITSL